MTKVAILCAACAAAVTGAEPTPGESESRQYQMSVDGKKRGKCEFRIRRDRDGAERMQVVSSLSFNFVVYNYRYRSAGTEVWQDDRLVELDNNADFNGSKYAVMVRRSKSGLDVTVNGETSSLPHDAWTTSYWRLPQSLASEFPGNPGESPIVRTNGASPCKIVLFDSDKGEQRRAEVIRLNDERLSVGGDDRVCSHYRLSGDVQVDLWYDGQRRLVRQESVEQGHKTAIQLTNITAD